MHVRHGLDITWNTRNIYHGHTVATANYFEKAINRYRINYKNLIIIIISDNLLWAKKNIKSDIKSY